MNGRLLADDSTSEKLLWLGGVGIRFHSYTAVCFCHALAI